MAYSTQEIQTCVWADQDQSIEETQITLESANSANPAIDTLLRYLYSESHFSLVNSLPTLDRFRENFPQVIFHRIDVDHENALAFKVLDYDRRTQMHNYKNYGGMMLGDWADRLSRDAVISAYSFPHSTGLPRLSLVTKSRVDMRRYTHLIWPLRDNGKVTELLVAASYQDLVVPAGISDRSAQIGPDEIGLPLVSRGREIFRSIKAQLGTCMAINAKGKSISMQISEIMGDDEVYALVN